MPDPYSPLYGQGEDLLQRAAQRARTGAEKVASAIRPGLPSSAAFEAPADTGVNVGKWEIGGSIVEKRRK